MKLCSGYSKFLNILENSPSLFSLLFSCFFLDDLIRSQNPNYHLYANFLPISSSQCSSIQCPIRHPVEDVSWTKNQTLPPKHFPALFHILINNNSIFPMGQKPSSLYPHPSHQIHWQISLLCFQNTSRIKAFLITFTSPSSDQASTTSVTTS